MKGNELEFLSSDIENQVGDFKLFFVLLYFLVLLKKIEEDDDLFDIIGVSDFEILDSLEDLEEVQKFIVVQVLFDD